MMLTVGSLAARCGLTIRALHHYDSIGLLSPSQRSEAGYRLYTEADQQRLVRILLLRSLGLSLDQCRRAIDDSQFSLEDCLRIEIERLNREINDQVQARNRLDVVLSRLADSTEVSVQELEEIMEAIKMFEKYYTPEQLEQLRARGEQVGAERIAEVEAEWPKLMASYQEAMDRGLAPDDPAVQELARRSRALIEEFTGGDAGIEKSLGAMYASEGPEAVAGPHGIPSDPGLWKYMADAGRLLED